MENSKIEWCDHTFNPWEGCTKVGPGCDHCYAETRNNRFGGGNWGPRAPRRRTSEANWKKPLKWDRDATEKGTRYRVFCASLADVFDNEVPPEWRTDLFRLILNTPNLDWLLLTKRIGNVKNMIGEVAGIAGRRGEQDSAWSETWAMAFDWLRGNPPPNVWLGATIVNQQEADRDIPKLLDATATVRFLSMEPLLGEVDLGDFLYRGDHGLADMDPLAASMLRAGERDGRTWVRPRIDWVIAGGESGPGARPMHPRWVHSLRDQCVAAGVPFLFKQWGEWCDWSNEDQTDHLYTRDLRRVRFPYLAIHVDGTTSPNASDLPNYNEASITQVYRVGKKVAGRTLNGRTWDEIPEAPCS